MVPESEEKKGFLSLPNRKMSESYLYANPENHQTQSTLVYLFFPQIQQEKKRDHVVFFPLPNRQAPDWIRSDFFSTEKLQRAGTDLLPGIGFPPTLFLSRHRITFLSLTHVLIF